MTTTMSVVIPVHNGAALLPRQLDAVAAGITEPAHTEILVVDNRSTDGSADAAQRWSLQREVPIRVVPAQDRAGEPHARNVGIHAAQGEVIAFCDADDEVAPTWVGAMATGLAAADYLTGPLDLGALNEPWQITTRSEIERDHPATTFGTIPFAHGCNMGFRRQLLLDLGGFDESFLIGCDIEIGVRVWRRGIPLVWAPGALVHYRLRPTLREAYRQSRAYARASARIGTLVADQVDERAERQAAVRRMAWLVRHSPELVSPPGRARWVWVAGQVVGRLHGAVARSRP